jgi:hypothetical protein
LDVRCLIGEACHQHEVVRDAVRVPSVAEAFRVARSPRCGKHQLRSLLIPPHVRTLQHARNVEREPRGVK